jgi:glycosyltransferase involved in cell wall biosynthesis
MAPNLRMTLFALQARLGRWPLWKKILAENALFQKEAAKIIFNGSLGAERHVLFSYSYAALDLFREAKRRGWQTVLGQIDPGWGEQRLVDKLRARFPEWAGRPEMTPPSYYWTEWREECDLADRIAVNSEWSKSLLVKEGIAVEKIEVVPLAYKPAGGRSDELRVKSSDVARSYPDEFSKERPMRVLFLGQAIVRKGIHDLADAARLLGDGPCHFDVVGRHPALPTGIPSSMTFHGQVPRNQAREWFERADVFVLPTHSDGFALTQLEAMAHGLPVIATPCCGEVVQDGINGVVVPAGDAAVLAEAIRGLAREPQRLAAMSRAALETVGDFGIDRVGDGLLGGVRASAQ